MGHWIKRIGIASFLAFPIAVILYRLGAISFRASLLLIQAGAAIGALVFLIGLVYFFVVKGKSPAIAKAALVGALIALVPVIPLALQAKKAKSLPFIHNVSTDLQDAPKFDKVLTLRSNDDNPHTYNASQEIVGVGTLGELQAGAYPDVTTHTSTLSVSEALSKAESVAKEMGWEIVNVDSAKGIVEATETTLLWGFKDDVVIRVQDQNGVTEVDLHSVSRFGGSDLGANAARIIAFLERFKK